MHFTLLLSKNCSRLDIPIISVWLNFKNSCGNELSVNHIITDMPQYKYLHKLSSLGMTRDPSLGPGPDTTTQILKS